MIKILFNTLLALFFLGSAAAQPVEPPLIQQKMLSDPESFYYIQSATYPKQDKTLPIGVFDSGTGGLTVFQAIATYDEHRNSDGAAGADGLPDFNSEDFVYLADQANMPYGNYANMGKTDFLRELILKDAQFLLGNRYHIGQDSLRTDKKKIKALVIACNTATAYGKGDIEALIRAGNLGVPVIGVIDAGAKGALSHFKPNESGTIGVFATAGTVASGGYARAILRIKQAEQYSGTIQVVNQGGVGIAEAIDEDLSYINGAATGIRDNYKGPNINSNTLAINKALLDLYNFDFSDNKMLCDAKKVDDCSNLQINSAENYVRYHLVSMLENMRNTPGTKPMKVLILGCTHYPYMKETIAKVLIELRNAKEGNKYRYRHLLAKKIELVDPSVNTARELYDYLHGQKMQNPQGNLLNSEFYISVPNPNTPKEGLDTDGTRFTYDFKYSRTPGSTNQYTLVVPFSKRTISLSVAERLRLQIPEAYQLIQHFDAKSDKTKYLRADEKL